MELTYNVQNVGTAGAAEQLTTSTRSARALSFQAAWGNTGLVYIGQSDVSSSKYMKALQPGQDWDVPGWINSSMRLDKWYVDAANTNDKAAWVALIRP